MAGFLRTRPTQTPGKYYSVGNVVPNHFWDGAETDHRWKSGVFLAEGVDASQTPTSLLRAGTLIAKVFGDADNKFFVPWNPVGTDGSQIIRGILKDTTDMAGSGTAVDKVLRYMAGGIVRPERLYIGGTSAQGLAGHAFEFAAKVQMANMGFEFSESDYQDRPLLMEYAPVQIDKATAYTVLEKENGSLFTNLGASASVAFTLPAPKRGLGYRFMTLAAQDLVITAPTVDTLIVASDVAADSATLTLAEIGAVAEVFCVRTAADTYKWVVKGQIAADSGMTIQT